MKLKIYITFLFLLLFCISLMAQTKITGLGSFNMTEHIKDNLPIPKKLNFFIIKDRKELSYFFKINQLDVKGSDFYSEKDLADNYCFLTIDNSYKTYRTHIRSVNHSWYYNYYIFSHDTLYITQEVGIYDSTDIINQYKVNFIDCDICLIPKSKLPGIKYVNFNVRGVVSDSITMSINDFSSCTLSPLPPVKTTLDDVDSSIYKEIENNLKKLSADDMLGRGLQMYQGHGARKAAKFLINKLKEYKVPAFDKTYIDSFTINELRVFDNGYNIIAKVEGYDSILKNEYILLTAHYDHLGKVSYYNKKDAYYNGANDNASGVVTVLNVAKHLVENKLNGRSILIVLFSGEELGRLGSKHFSDNLPLPSSDIYALVNIEMVGVPMDNILGRMYVSGAKLSNIVEKLNDYNGKEVFVSDSTIDAPYVFQDSDNYSFYYDYSFPTHTLSSYTYENFDYYHTMDDDFKWINMNHLYLVNTELLNILIKMSNTKSREINRYPNVRYESR